MAERRVIWFGKHVYKTMKDANEKALLVMGAYGAGVCKQLAPVDTGLLKSSITYATALELGRPTQEGRVTAKDKHMISQPSEHYRLKIGTAVDYAPHVEYGTKAHFPPVKSLVGWAKRVLGNPRLAFVVARAISKKGTKRQSFLRLGVLSHRKELGQIYSKAMKGLLK